MNRSFLPASPVVLVMISVGCAGGRSASGDPYATYDACVQAETQLRARAAVPKAAPMGPFSASLLQTDPEQVASALREDMKSDMLASVESARASRIAAERCRHLRSDLTRDGASVEASKAGAAPSQGSGASMDSGGAKQTSGTNNQVAGVDEADFIKNDERYLYVAAGSRFRIIEAWPATETHEIASVTVPGEAKKLFVEGNRALVYSSVVRASPSHGSSGADAYAGKQASSGSAAIAGGGRGRECTYGYDGCVPSGDGTETAISIFDITSRASPRLVRTIRSSSSLIAARRIGTAVHTVLAQPSPAHQRWHASPSRLAAEATEEQIDVAFDALLEENTAAIDEVDVASVLPTWSDSGGRAPDVSVFRSSMPDGTALTSLLSIDLVADPTIKIASVLGRPGWVYASRDSLYMAVPHQQISGWGWYEGRSENELSTIHRFSIGATPSATSYAGSGVVKGRVLNQFAMDDRDGFLRVATTTGHLPSPDAHNTISVLEDKGGKLDVVGQIDPVAKGEDIRSVRFDGTRGYVVTFKKTDPLLVFDLADPRAPKTLGELKIPGFSTYMHMMDATHLLTIGYDAADQGSFAYFTGVLLQIFDVSNPTDPKLAHKEVIGTRGSSSEALTNHLAFNYFGAKNLLALPMTICEGGDGNGHYGTEMTFSGLMVYDATAARGFSLRGRVAHPNASPSGDPQNRYGYYDMGCMSWWTNAQSEVKRSVFMDDYVFSVSDTRIKVNDLRALSTDIKELSIR